MFVSVDANVFCYSVVFCSLHCYVKNMMYISDLLGGSMTTNIRGLHVVLMWIMLTMMNWRRSMEFEQQQSNYGRRIRINIGQFGIDIVNSLIVVTGLKACASRFVFTVSVGYFYFPCDVEWVDSREKTSL